MKVVLASKSPRRKELLSQMGIAFEIQVSDADETSTETVPGKIVEELSRKKALAVAKKITEETIVIGADTLVFCDAIRLGKPKDAEDAKRMLQLLQGRTHTVSTGVTLINTKTGRSTSFHETTNVTFSCMTEKEIDMYVASGECNDKAGAYAIQGIGSKFIARIDGDYNTVVGLPINRLYHELHTFCAAPEEVKLAIFDLDGTLSDSIASIKYCGDACVEAYGYGPFSVEQYFYFVGDGAANLVKRILLAGGDTTLSHYEEAYARYKELFAEYCMYQVKPYEGIIELLQGLKQREIKLAELSNKPHQETIHVIETLFGKDYFDVIWGQKEGIPVKPDPTGAKEVLKALGIAANQVVYLGDTATDMKTGKGLGAFTVGVLWGFRTYEELAVNGADCIIAHPTELLDRI